MPAKKKPATKATKSLPKKLSADNAKQVKGGAVGSAFKYIKLG